MSTKMCLAVLRMDYEQAMLSELARWQYHQRGIEAAEEIEQLQERVKVLELDKARLDWLESDPRLAELTTNGTTVDCYYYAVAGAPGLKLREIMDATMARAVLKAAL